MRQLLTLNEQIEELKWQRKMCGYSRGSLESSCTMDASLATLSDTDGDNSRQDRRDFPSNYPSPSSLSLFREQLMERDRSSSDSLNRIYVLDIISLKRKLRRHSDVIFVASCTGSCHIDQFQYNLWRKYRQNVISISAFSVQSLHVPRILSYRIDMNKLFITELFVFNFYSQCPFSLESIWNISNQSLPCSVAPWIIMG